MTRLRPVATGVLIAATYTVLMTLPVGGNRTDPALTAASGVIVATLVVPIAPWVCAVGWRRFGAWFLLLFLNFVSVAIEGTLFSPASAPPSQLGLNVIRLAAASVSVAALAMTLGRSEILSPGGGQGPHRRWYDWTWRVLTAALIYVVVYFIVGGLNYTFVTHPFYESHSGGLTLPPLQVVFSYEPVRGVLIALSVLPMVVVLQMRGAQLAAVIGAMLFIVGGAVVLLPETSLPLYLRLASLWEIFVQNAITGIACAYLFRAKAEFRPAIGGRPRAKLHSHHSA